MTRKKNIQFNATEQELRDFESVMKSYGILTYSQMIRTMLNETKKKICKK